MVKLTVENVVNVMEDRERIRNISVIAHVDHGKSTLTDSLVHKAGLIKQENVGNRRYTDTMKQEIERGVTIKSTSITLIHEMDKKEENEKEKCGGVYMVNVIDSPGHIDFSSEVTAALRCTDGAVVVIDAVEGFAAQTKTVVKQALKERVRPVLMINKIDRLILEIEKTPEELYIIFENLLAKTNGIIQKFQDDSMGDLSLHPLKGNVCFGSGKHGFAWTLQSFFKMFSKVHKKLRKKEKWFTKRLWGDWFYDPSTDKIIKKKISPKTGKKLKRTFVEFILEPIFEIYRLFDGVQSDKKYAVEIEEFLKKYKIKLKTEEAKKITQDSKNARNLVLQKFLPAADSLLDMIVSKLPSPLEAQKYRYEVLLERVKDGSKESEEFQRAIMECDPNGPLCFYITKNVEIGNRTVCFGRIFSGTIKNSNRCHVLADEGKRVHIFKNTTIQNVMIMLAKNSFDIPHALAGCVVAVTGIDKYVVKTATVCDVDPKTISPVKSLKFSVSPVVQIGVGCKKGKNLKNLLNGIKKMVKSDPILQCSVDNETGQLVLRGSGEFHLSLTLEILRTEICKNLDIVTSQMIVSFKESISERGKECVAKSRNSHNRIFVEIEPLPAEVIKGIEEGTITPNNAKFELKKHGWDKHEIKRIWGFAPDPKNTCVLVNMTKGVMYINDVKDSIISGFQYACKEGVLAKEEMRGVRVNILDGVFHGDPVHRGGSQIIPMTKKAIYASILNASPRLHEPFYNFEVQTCSSRSGTVYNVLKKRRAVIYDMENSTTQSDGVVINGSIPVMQSFGIVEELRTKSSGEAYTSLTFSHYDEMSGDCLDEEEESHSIVKDIRKRKYMKLEVPKVGDYEDRL